MNLEELREALDILKQIPAASSGWSDEQLDAQRKLVRAARLVANPNIQEWIDEAALALDAATTIGQRSCNSGDHLHYANHDRLIASKPDFAALTITRRHQMTCPYGDPTCPCPDGDPCHYEGDDPMTPPEDTDEH